LNSKIKKKSINGLFMGETSPEDRRKTEREKSRKSESRDTERLERERPAGREKEREPIAIE